MLGHDLVKIVIQQEVQAPLLSRYPVLAFLRRPRHSYVHVKITGGGGESYRTKRTFWSNKCDEMPRSTSALVVGSRVAHAKPSSQVFA